MLNTNVYWIFIHVLRTALGSPGPSAEFGLWTMYTDKNKIDKTSYFCVRSISLLMSTDVNLLVLGDLYLPGHTTPEILLCSWYDSLWLEYMQTWLQRHLDSFGFASFFQTAHFLLVSPMWFISSKWGIKPRLGTYATPTVRGIHKGKFVPSFCVHLPFPGCVHFMHSSVPGQLLGV